MGHFSNQDAPPRKAIDRGGNATRSERTDFMVRTRRGVGRIIRTEVPGENRAFVFRALRLSNRTLRLFAEHDMIGSFAGVVGLAVIKRYPKPLALFVGRGSPR
jgi:hypothetical protein